MSADAFARLYRSRTPLDADTAKEISASLTAIDKAKHAAVADLEDLTVATVDVDHFKALGVRAVNPI
jgi:hypothetical protein